MNMTSTLLDTILILFVALELSTSTAWSGSVSAFTRSSNIGKQLLRYHNTRSLTPAAASFEQSSLSILAAAEAAADTSTDAIQEYDGSASEESAAIYLKPLASAGLSTNELDVVLSAISTACSREDISFISTNEDNNADSEYGSEGVQHSTPRPAIPKSMPGATGRVVLLTAHGTSLEDGEMMNDDDEWLLPIQYAISEQLDISLFQDPTNGFDQPVLVHLCPYNQSLNFGSEEDMLATLSAIVKEEADEYELCKPLAVEGEVRDVLKADEDTKRYVPSLHIEIDGAMVENIESKGGSHWDTSTVLVFDNLVDDDLRKRLLDVVLGRNDDDDQDNPWNDIENGPDPRRWVRGGLSDVPDEESSEEAGCWGLSDEAIMDLCYKEHAAIQDLEGRLRKLFPDFVVSRLPEAVLGASVSPLTANAPTHGDMFDWHIDADPLRAPPSPWTDVYGRYPNRSAGKPRFMSFLIYLNDEWDDEYGAPTQFLDPPTGETVEVIPKPGRCVLMDQDCSHTVTAPSEASGRRPRYSIVWKLILHPTAPDQDVTFLSTAAWPQPTFVGSASPSPTESAGATAA